MRHWFRFCLLVHQPPLDPSLNFTTALLAASNAQLLLLSVEAEHCFIAFAIWLATTGRTKVATIRTYCTAIRSTLLDWAGIPTNLTVEWRRLPRLMKSLKWIFQEGTRSRMPILQQHLLRIRQELDLNDTDDLAFYTALTLGWNGLLRSV